MAQIVGIGAYLIFWVIYMAVILGIALVFYLMNAVGIMTISKKLGLSGGWRGFLPIFDMYQMGKIADEDQVRCHPEKKASNWRKWMVITYVVYFVIAMAFMMIAIATAALSGFAEQEEGVVLFMMVGIVLMLVGYVFLFAGAIALSVVQYIVLYKIFHVMAGEHAVWMLILSILVSNAYSVILLVLGLVKKFPLYTPEPLFEQDQQQISAESLTE
ncbi:MAG: hypothetical protein IJX59_01850 [Clostridia bacterium]|nr:hypothetical protein [Clostridia bacterium]MBQ9129489.1 hypothetical protein [Clostridia bacterium]